MPVTPQPRGTRSVACHGFPIAADHAPPPTTGPTGPPPDKRSSWASGPSSRTTVAGPRPTGSACGCAPAQGVPSSPAVAARAAPSSPP